ncbi:MAG: aldehyde dehydrogenase family protein [Pseudomonadota bacterium]
MNVKPELMVPGAAAAGWHPVSTPYNHESIGEVPTIDSKGAEQAMQTAYSAFRDRSQWLAPEVRIHILEKTAALMQERFDMLAFEAASEGGKPLLDSKVEVARAIDGVKNTIECLRSESGREIPMNLNAASANRLAFTRREPIGVVMAVSAFNHPLNLIVHQVAPAVATGCPVIVKPAEDTPISCFRFVEILREAGLPEAHCQAVMTSDLEVASQLVTDARVGFFSFIGSAKVGWMLRSQLAPGARCALEHGGAAPVIIAEDADLDDTLPLIAKGGFYHAGQVCVSVQRVFAHRDIARQVAERLVELSNDMTIGDPTLEETDIGPLIRPREVDRVESWVSEAKESGAECLSGGERLSDTCYQTTVLYDPPVDSKVSQLEIFGPVVCVYPYDDIDDAIERANALDVAFQASVLTRDIDTAMHCYQSLDASAVMVNDHTAYRVDWMPFAGLRQSGLGVGGIPYTFEDMQIEKMMMLRSRAL